MIGKKYEVVLDVPNEAVTIFFGILVEGKGQVWADDFNLEVVDNRVPTTNMMSDEDMKRENLSGKREKSDAKQPVNLGFENGMVQ